MATDLPLQCRCGHVRGTLLHVSPKSGNHATCYCRDCRAFAHYLERPDVLDVAGGTDIFQLPPCDLRIDAGADAIRCVRLSDKGMFRFYTECCRTPIGNIVSPSVPFVGVITTFVAPLPAGKSFDDAMGKAVGMMGKDATGTPPHGAHPKMPVGMMLHVLPLMLGWWLKGKGTPSPFADPQTKAVIAPTKVLTPQERSAL